jgi:hypothetical protein
VTSADMSKASHWRMRAAEVRVQADQARDPWVAGKLRELAARYDELADNEQTSERKRRSG